MRRSWILLLLIITLVFTLGAVGCGDENADEGSIPGVGDSKAPTPSEIMAKMTAVTEPAPTQAGTFEATINLDVDTSEMSEDEAAMFADPWVVSGTFASETATQAADVTMALTLMGETMNMGVKTLGQQTYMSLGGQWYETPAEMTEGMGLPSTEGLEPMIAKAEALISEVQLDPVSWFKSQQPVSQESVDGVDCYHIAASDPDWAKVIADLVTIMQNPNFAALVGEAGSTAEAMELPTAEELLEMQSMFEAMVETFKIDLWVGKDDSQLRKATITARMAPPSAEDMAALDSGMVSGMDFEGLNSADITATLNLKPNEAVKVAAPESFLPYTDMETAIMEDPSLLGPFGTLLSGMMGSSTY